MIDAVLSYHADGLTCGVTKFSQMLARKLGVPWNMFYASMAISPLISWKASEQPICPGCYDTFDLFLHEPVAHSPALPRASRVFAASADIAETMRRQRPDIVAAWCPSLVEAEVHQPITVLSMGMAHKLRIDLYAILKEKLDDTGEPYVVYVSAALHDGTTFSEASKNFDQLRRLFGASFVFLGTLSDEALAERFRTCTYVAAFFEHGLHENNTSVMAALDAGATVLSNFESQTPSLLQALVNDIRHDHLPRSVQQAAIRARYGWEPLVDLIRHA